MRTNEELADLIEQGSKLIHEDDSVFLVAPGKNSNHPFDDKPCGCALGMAFYAVVKTTEVSEERKRIPSYVKYVSSVLGIDTSISYAIDHLHLNGTSAKEIVVLLRAKLYPFN